MEESSLTSGSERASLFSQPGVRLQLLGFWASNLIPGTEHLLDTRHWGVAQEGSASCSPAPVGRTGREQKIGRDAVFLPSPRLVAMEMPRGYPQLIATWRSLEELGFGSQASLQLCLRFQFCSHPPVTLLVSRGSCHLLGQGLAGGLGRLSCTYAQVGFLGSGWAWDSPTCPEV